MASVMALNDSVRQAELLLINSTKAGIRSLVVFSHITGINENPTYQSLFSDTSQQSQCFYDLA